MRVSLQTHLALFVKSSLRFFVLTPIPLSSYSSPSSIFTSSSSFRLRLNRPPLLLRRLSKHPPSPQHFSLESTSPPLPRIQHLLLPLPHSLSWSRPPSRLLPRSSSFSSRPPSSLPSPILRPRRLQLPHALSDRGSRDVARSRSVRIHLGGRDSRIRRRTYHSRLRRASSRRIRRKLRSIERFPSSQRARRGPRGHHSTAGGARAGGR